MSINQSFQRHNITSTNFNIGLAPELREGDTANKLPTKVLMEKLSEGRSRVVALCRLCYGDDSVESLRASVDLASSYALQGMWGQVNEHIARLVSTTIY